MRKKLVIAVSALLVTLLIGSALAVIYWQRQLTYNFKVVGIEAELLEPTKNGYLGKIVAENLTVDNQVAVVIYNENFNNVWLNVTVTSDATGLACEITGQYWMIYDYFGGISHAWYFEAVGDSFSFENGTSQVMDKTQMMWHYPQLSQVAGENGPPEYCLVVSFVWDTELVVVPNNYVATMTFQMGFV